MGRGLEELLGGRGVEVLVHVEVCLNQESGRVKRLIDRLNVDRESPGMSTRVPQSRDGVKAGEEELLHW